MTYHLCTDRGRNILNEKMSLHAERTAVRVAFEANLYKILGFLGKGHWNRNPYDLPIFLITFPVPENTSIMLCISATSTKTRKSSKAKLKRIEVSLLLTVHNLFECPTPILLIVVKSLVFFFRKLGDLEQRRLSN